MSARMLDRLEGWWTDLPTTRRGSLLNTAIRTLLFPLFLVAELLSVASRLAEEEEVGYNANSGSKILNAIVCCILCAQVVGGSPLLSTELCAGKVNIYVDRFRGCWEESVPLFLQAFVYVIFLDVLAALGLQHLIRNFRPELESACAAISGSPTPFPHQ